MQIILLSAVPKLGELGDTVKVKSGYARNFLIPKGKAKLATPENIALVAERRVELEREQAKAMTEAGARAAGLADQVITIARKAGVEGKLFGSVGAQDIAEAIVEAVAESLGPAGFQVKRQEIRMPAAGPIRQTGEYSIGVQLHADTVAEIKLVVVAES